MRSERAQNLLDELQQTIETVQTLRFGDVREDGYLGQYLVVLICGVYEEAIENIITERITSMDSPQAVKFIDNTLHKHFRTPRFEDIEEILKEFDEAWNVLGSKCSKHEKLALDSLVFNRHLVAHGGKTSVTIKDAADFFSGSRRIIEIVDQIVLGP